MARVQKKIEGNFTVVQNDFMRDVNLGIAERGILVTMLSMADSYNFTIKGLASQLPDGKDKVANALKKLEKLGYLKRTKLCSKDGKVLDMEYRISDRPIFLDDDDADSDAKNENCLEHMENIESENEDNNVLDIMPPSVPDLSPMPQPEKPHPENPDTAKPDAENPDDKEITKEEIPIEESIHLSTAVEKVEKIDKMDWIATQEQVKEQIEMPYLLEMKNTAGQAIYHREQVEELIQLITWVYLASKKSVRINGTDMPIEIVRSVFHKLSEEHIIYVLDCLKSNPNHIKSRRSYLLTALYNAIYSMDGYYENQVQADFFKQQKSKAVPHCENAEAYKSFIYNINE